MAQTVTTGNNSGTAAPVKSTRSGVEILDEIKSHHFVYKKSKEDAEGFVKMLDMLRRNYSFTDVAVSVKVNETFRHTINFDCLCFPNFNVACNLLHILNLRFQGEIFPCHKVVLAASSDYFKALFAHDGEKSGSENIVLDGISPNGFKHLLTYMYTHQLEIDVENILDILEAADFLQFRSIVEKCSSMSLQHITIENCLALHQIGEAHSCRALADAVYNFIMRNFEKISQSKEFLHLGLESLLGFLKDEHLQIKDEAKLLENLCAWMAFDIERRKSALWELVQCVDLPSIDKYKLKEITSMDQQIMELFKDIAKEYENTDDGSFIQAKSQLKKRPTEVLAIIPREITVSDFNRNKEILYYCPRELKWKTLTGISFKDRQSYDVAVLDNDIYFTGGIQYNLTLDEVMVYSVKTDEWLKCRPMIKCRSHHSSAAMAGKVYVVGGRNLEEARWESRTIILRNDGEEFDPRSNQWTLLAEQLSISGIGRAAVVPLDDKLFVIGGTMETEGTNQGSSSRKAQMATMYYDSLKKSWHDLEIGDTLERMKIAVSVGDCLPYEGCILLIDEDLRGKRMAVFNPVSGQVHTFIRTHGSHKFAGYALQDHVLYLTGGVAGIFKTHDLVHYQDLTDPEGTWQILTPLPSNYSHHACVSIFKVL